MHCLAQLLAHLLLNNCQESGTMEGNTMSIRKSKKATRANAKGPGSKQASRVDRLFDELFNTYHNRVFYIARRYTNNNDDALDLVQEIFIKAYRALDSFDGKGNYGPWIYRIAVNHCIDRIRKKRRLELSYDEYVENGGAIAGITTAPQEDLSGNDLRNQVLELVDKLSPEHRAVFLLHCMENLPYKQIARVIGCSIGTVMSRLHYARKYLRQSMQANAVV
jgi:RNA polymerase sigma-70 factor (ECF subfamily)